LTWFCGRESLAGYHGCGGAGFHGRVGGGGDSHPYHGFGYHHFCSLNHSYQDLQLSNSFLSHK
tara:strand:+ start:338 stop:526 length:189 start_codon:yes stop_codon:yes gene_type:complete